MTATPKTLTLAEFMKRPETQPPWEFMDGEIVQKPVLQGQHSLIQIELCQAIDRVARPNKIAKAFPELRCTFGGNSFTRPKPNQSASEPLRWANYPP